MYTRYDRRNKSILWKLLDTLSALLIFGGLILLTILLFAI